MFHNALPDPCAYCLCTADLCGLQDSALQKTADWVLSVAIPVHMQITTNALVTDYVATKFRGECCDNRLK